MRPSNVVPIRKAAVMPAPIIVDYHKPLPDHDPHWGTILTGLLLISWVCCLAALHWAMR